MPKSEEGGRAGLEARPAGQRGKVRRRV